MQKPCLINSAGKELAATLHLPVKKIKPSLPGVLLCHGFTGNRIESRRLFVRLSWHLEKQGIASLRFDYRGCGESPGEFVDSTIQNYIKDAIAALKYLASLKTIDSNRIGILGYSLGGCVASYASASAIVSVKSIVLWAPVAQPEKIFYANREIPGLNFEKAKSLPYIEHHGWRIGRNFIKGLRTLNPLKKISAAFAPVLLCQGLDDDVVPVSQLKLYEAELKKSGIPVETFLIKKAGHNFSSVDNDKMIFSRTVQWFASTLK